MTTTPETCARCSTPLAPQGLYAAWQTQAAYCCADCAAGKQCVCALVADPHRGGRLSLVPTAEPIIRIERSRTLG